MIYLEDQYLWSAAVTRGHLREALERSPELRVIAVVPRYPDQDGRISGPPARYAQLRGAADLLRRRIGSAVYDLENEDGVPIYVHAKVCIVDDEWFDLRLGQLQPPVLDQRQRTDLRGGELRRPGRGRCASELWSEHLGTDDPTSTRSAASTNWQEQAAALDDWHADWLPWATTTRPDPPAQPRARHPPPVPLGTPARPTTSTTPTAAPARCGAEHAF